MWCDEAEDEGSAGHDPDGRDRRPYVGYLINGETPFIKDPRGMSATGLVLGVAAYLLMRRDDPFDRVGKAETALAVASLALGVGALALAETAAAEVLLAVFMGSILLVGPWSCWTTRDSWAGPDSGIRRRSVRDNAAGDGAYWSVGPITEPDEAA